MLLRVSLLAVVFIYCMMSYRIGYMISFLFIVPSSVSHCAANVLCVFLCAGKMGKRWKSGILFQYRENKH